MIPIYTMYNTDIALPALMISTLFISMSSRFGWASDFFETSLGRMIRGIIKLVLAGLLISLVNALNGTSVTITIGGDTYDLTAILQVLIAFFPIMLVISAMRDLGIKI